ncbi:MAG: serine/threonine-protein kinase [Verrucomicrobiales bacterium]
MNHPPADPSSSDASTSPLPNLPQAPERPHGLDPRALLEAAAADVSETGGSGPPGPPPTAEELAAAFPQLEIGECLGRGGMGVVYRARQRSLDRSVALKLLAPERIDDHAFAERFTREAQALAKLNHPNIVTVHDFGRAGRFYFLLMEFVDGVNLRQAMQAGRFTPEQALAVVPPVCEALHYAHGRGLVHRDIKPENLLLDRDGRIKIADFGIAKMMDADEPDVGVADAGVVESQPAGTPRYMAPEQCDRTRRTDHRADIYSLGVVLYELLTGEVPAGRLQPPSRRVQIDVRLDEIVLRALETEPERRYQTAAEFRTRVEELDAAARPLVVPTDGVAPSAPATASTPGAAAVAPRLLRSGHATVTTPERLATAAGQFFLFRNNRHSLVLDDTRLTVANGPNETVIPLAAIRDLSIGRFPRLVNPAGLDFISLTYQEGGALKRLLVAPFEGIFGVPADWNKRVHEWWTAIRDAALSATGRAPVTTPASQLGTPRSAPWLAALLLLPVVVGAILAILLLGDSAVLPLDGARRPSSGPGLLTVVLLTLAALTPMLIVRRLCEETPGWVGPAIGLVAGLFSVVLLLGRPGFLEIVILSAMAGFAVYSIKKRSGTDGGRVSSDAHWSVKIVEVSLFALALALTVNFAAPHRSVLGAGNVETWTVGLSHPWISDVKHTYPGGGQRLRDMNLNEPSFYCGFGALALWMLWLRLRAQRLGTAVFEVVRPAVDPGERPRIQWFRLAVVWTVMASLSVIGILLVCVVMHFVLGGFPSPMPLLLMAVFPVSVVILVGIRQGLRQLRQQVPPAPAPAS